MFLCTVGVLGRLFVLKIDQSVFPFSLDAFGSWWLDGVCAPVYMLFIVYCIGADSYYFSAAMDTGKMNGNLWEDKAHHDWDVKV